MQHFEIFLFKEKTNYSLRYISVYNLYNSVYLFSSMNFIDYDIDVPQTHKETPKRTKISLVLQAATVEQNHQVPSFEFQNVLYGTAQGRSFIIIQMTVQTSSLG